MATSSRTGTAKRGGKSAAKKARTRTSARKGAKTAKRGASATRRKTATKDPKGGLTAAGRAEAARKEGAHLKPGVKKAERDMTVEEMRRKGSWASRFYGRKELPPLLDENGEPTRFALTAAAWGEPVPKTVAAARAIAKKGKRLLEKARARAAKKA